mmetsp:Transcript_28098/g.45243  ORF Transcript_28098/g.45243 Transcript_28098/m.45243 type:complete len:223 (-) Transcript_28098:400-1068(-)
MRGNDAGRSGRDLDLSHRPNGFCRTVFLPHDVIEFVCKLDCPLERISPVPHLRRPRVVRFTAEKHSTLPQTHDPTKKRYKQCASIPTSQQRLKHTMRDEFHRIPILMEMVYCSKRMKNSTENDVEAEVLPSTRSQLQRPHFPSPVSDPARCEPRNTQSTALSRGRLQVGTAADLANHGFVSPRLMLASERRLQDCYSQSPYRCFLHKCSSNQRESQSALPRR